MWSLEVLLAASWGAERRSSWCSIRVDAVTSLVDVTRFVSWDLSGTSAAEVFVKRLSLGTCLIALLQVVHSLR